MLQDVKVSSTSSILFCIIIFTVKHIEKRQEESTDTDDNPGQACCDGQPGPPGLTGRDGRDGVPGSQGVAGRDGRDGVPGPRGVAGRDGKTGPQGMKGDTGPQGLPGPRSGGVTYVRWGRTTCPDTEGTEVVYTGRAAGTHYQHAGGTNDYLCLPGDPEYSELVGTGTQDYSPLHGAEYQPGGNQPLNAYHQHNVPCVVCCTSLRVSVLVIPARLSCPPTWTLEYCGYLMTAHRGNHRQSAACVDKDPEAVRGEAADTNGALLYHMEATCNGLDCPPYDPQKELTCVVCTK